MEINPEVLNKILGPIKFGDEEAIKISLFIASNKSPGLKKLDLTNLTPEKRAEKLHRWAEGHRFVAVIEMSDKIYAHAQAGFAEKLKGRQDLTVNGKKVEVNALTEEQYQRLSAVGEAFEEYLLLTPQEEQKNEELVSESRDNLTFLRQYFSRNWIPTEYKNIDAFIARMENVPHKVIMNFLRRMSEMQREIEEQKKEQEEQRDIEKTEEKRQLIKRRIVKQEIVNNEIVQEEIAKSDNTHHRLKHS